ncbi:MAG: hypothetical protein RL683_1133 [Actinomycetota bacterium]
MPSLPIKNVFLAFSILFISLVTVATAIEPAKASVQNFTVDCSTLASGTTVFSVNVGDSGSISMSNCASPTYASNPIWIEDIETVAANTTLHFTSQPAAITSTYWLSGKMIELRVIGNRPLPVGSVQSVQTLTIGPNYLNIPKFTLTTDDTGNGETLIANNSACAFETGAHPYSSKEFTVTKSGNYTFRTVEALSDGDNGMNRPAAFDSGLILYRSFDAERPTENVLGCGIASGPNPDAYYRTSNGLVLSGYLTEFSIDLAPGTYELVLVPQDFQEESDWINGAQTNRVEIWGLPNSLNFGQELANTGVDLRGAWFGFAFLLVGGALLTLNRRKQHV